MWTIAYGVMTDGEGRPIGVEVYPADTSDPTTVSDQAEKLQKRFGVSRVVFVGDKGLNKVAERVLRPRRKPMGKAEIGLRVGRVLLRFKVAKHFKLKIEDGVFAFSRREESLAEAHGGAIRVEQALDGIYVIRTTDPKERLSS